MMFLDFLRNKQAGNKQASDMWSDDDWGTIGNECPHVSASNAMTLASVYACVTMIADDISTMPLHVYRKTAKGRELLTNHRLNRLLKTAPNSWMTSVDYFATMVHSLLLYGEFYARIDDAGTTLTPIDARQVSTQVDSRGRLVFKHGQINYTQGQIHRVINHTSDGIHGMGPITAKRTFELSQATEIFGTNFFANGARPGSILQTPLRMSVEAANAIRKRFEALFKGKNSGSVAILQEGMSYHPISLSNEDSQFLETRAYQRSEIASLFKIPAALVGDSSKATLNNVEQYKIIYVTQALLPLIRRIEASIKRDLIVEDDVYVKFSTEGLLRGDTNARTAYYATMVNIGALTRNEVRQLEDLNPLDGLDAPLVPLNMGDNSVAG